MLLSDNLKPQRVFKYFEEICAIPHGSGNMDKIAEYCMDFAKSHSLKAERDEANNVIIYKKATTGFENSDTVILQGHLDMVCQKEEWVDIDFENDPIQAYIDGDYIKAKGTTLGGDNGIAVAMILAILENTSYEHPAIEAVFTTDEEIGMIGASKLDFSLLNGKKMINIDSEDQDVLTVSCAGGSDFEMTMPLAKKIKEGKLCTLTVRGLKGGHSGVEIDKGRQNANMIMARILNFAGCDLISIDGGDKGNAIPVCSKANVLVSDKDNFVIKLTEYANIIKKEMQFREDGFEFLIEEGIEGKFEVIDTALKDKIIFMLLCVPNGVVEMSAEINNLVETSLNLGILKTENDVLRAHFALRSNKTSALVFLEDRLKAFADLTGFSVKTFGHYPPWEFKSDSALQRIYRDKYKEKTGKEISVEAIHAGLECGVFASSINDLDCISVGPRMFDIHTPAERLCISSVKTVFDIILEVLKEIK